MRVTLPTKAELDRQNSFQVLKNYLCASVQCIADVHGTTEPAVLLRAQRSLPAYERIRRRDLVDVGELRQALILSWASRLQLGLARLADHDAAIAYANAWAPVHAYYSVYGTVRAWSIAQGQPLNDHTAALNTISEAAAKRQTLPTPWSVACIGCPDIDEPVGFAGLPMEAMPDSHVQLLGNAHSDLAWPRFLKLLETTRRQVLAGRYKSWCYDHRRKITRAGEKRDIASRVIPTTVFDAFWRLRVRANYRDAESFVLVTGDADSHRAFHDALVELTDLSALLVENLVVQQVGLPVYRRISEDFQRYHVPGGPTDFVGERLAALSVRTR